MSAVAAVIAAMKELGRPDREIVAVIEAMEGAQLRSAAAIRQARYRERQATKKATSHNESDVTRDVTKVTVEAGPRARVLCGDNIIIPTDPTDQLPLKGAKRSKGTRIPDDFAANAELIEFGRSVGLSDRDVTRCVPEFCDYWRGVPGAKGIKTDWPATFRNHLRRLSERKGFARPPPDRSGGDYLAKVALYGLDHDEQPSDQLDLIDITPAALQPGYGSADRRDGRAAGTEPGTGGRVLDFRQAGPVGR